MSVPDISAEDLARVEAMLMEDIGRAVASGPGWDPYHGAEYSRGKWRDAESPFGRKPCGVCAIGAVCLVRQPELVFGGLYNDASESAARALGVDAEWCSALYWAVADEDNEPTEGYSEQIWELSRRLRAHGDSLMAAKAGK